MTPLRSTRWPLLLSCVAALAAGAARADGGPPPSAAAPADPVIARATYRCQGGVQVQVEQRTGTARVTFAGRTRILRLVRDASGTHYQNAQFAWFSRGNTATMRRTQGGQPALSGCVLVP
ncbi:MliC family protein [Deinococcus sonorensis]|uniref:MliC family protein n=2 Tax=Deinococcus sonorensis TaxID=309891 RepID=A0AAU7UEN5_9DEIO